MWRLSITRSRNTRRTGGRECQLRVSVRQEVGVNEFASIPPPEHSPRQVVSVSLRRVGVLAAAGRVSQLQAPGSVSRIGSSKRRVRCVVASCRRPLRLVAFALGSRPKGLLPQALLQSMVSRSRRAALAEKSKRTLERLVTLTSRVRPQSGHPVASVALNSVASSRVEFSSAVLRRIH